MHIFKKVHIKMIHSSDVRRIYLFDRPIIQYVYQGKKRKWSVYRQPKPSQNQRIFYLKINRIHQTAFDCIQHWMDVIAQLDGFCYFVCDKKAMEYGMFSKPCYFHSDKYAFIPSDRHSLRKPIKQIFKNIPRNNLWQRIAMSMMTPFTHAASHEYSGIYNIDADDIMIVNKSQPIADAFRKMEQIAQDKKIDCFNLDMFVNKSFGVHWSFGVVYIQNPQHVIDVIKSNTNWRQEIELQKKYKTIYIDKFNYNVDWFFTFLRDTKKLNLKTFYINNAMVVHMPDIALNRRWAFMFQWTSNGLYFPIIDKFYGDKIWTKLPILRGDYKNRGWIEKKCVHGLFLSVL